MIDWFRKFETIQEILVLEKETFPRDKICGDQIQPQVQFILSDMGILQSLLDDDVVKWVRTGLFDCYSH